MKKIKIKITHEMIDDLRKSYNINSSQSLEETIAEELDKYEIKQKINERKEKNR